MGVNDWNEYEGWEGQGIPRPEQRLETFEFSLTYKGDIHKSSHKTIRFRGDTISDILADIVESEYNSITFARIGGKEHREQFTQL